LSKKETIAEGELLVNRYLENSKPYLKETVNLEQNSNGKSKSLQILPPSILLKNAPESWLDLISNPIAIFQKTTLEIIYLNQSFFNTFKLNSTATIKLKKINSYILDLNQVQNRNIIASLKVNETAIIPRVTLKCQNNNVGLFQIFLNAFNQDQEELVIAILNQIDLDKKDNIVNNISYVSNLINNLPGIAYHCRNDQDWTMEFISDECWKLTGYSSAELIENNKCSYSNLIHKEDLDYVWNSIQEAVAKHQPYCLEYRILTRSGELKWVWEKGRGVHSADGKLLFLDGIILDISERKKNEIERNLLLKLTKAITQTNDFETALLITLKEVCEATGWDFGEAWLPDSNYQVLEYGTAWFSSTKNYHSNYPFSLAEFKEQSYQYKFPKSVGLPGKIWELAQAYWLKDVSVEPLFLRHQLALDCGLKAGFGIPILVEEKLVAVLVFFMREYRQEEPELITLVKGVTYQLSSIFQHKQIEFAFQESQRQLTSLINATSGIFFRLSYNPSWRRSYLSDGCEYLTGYSKEELLTEHNCNLAQITHPLDLQRLISVIEQAINNKTSYIVEYRIFPKDNQEKWVWEKGHGVFNNEGELLGIEGFITDISDRKEIEEALEEAEAKYRNIFENAIEGIFQTTIDGHYLCANNALAKMYGYNSPKELINDLRDIEHQLYVDSERRKEFISILQENEVVTNFESEIYHKSGQTIWISENARAIKDKQGNVIYYEGTVEDISEYKKAKEELHKKAFYDGLTNLPNRSFFLQKLEEVIENFKLNYPDSSHFAIIFIDSDRFKNVNDSLGHLMGDKLLIEIARLLENSVRRKDLVARLGGDEFIILLENIPDIQEVIKVADRIKNKFKTPFEIDEHKIFSGVSMGIFYSGYIDESESLSINAANMIQSADTALYQAKSKGKGSYEIFQSEMHQKAMLKFQIENDLRQAIEKEELRLYYQPIVSIFTGEITGFEVLLRWQHPEKGLIRPGEFIEIAEETGLITPLGFWVLKQACFQLAEWEKKLPHNISLSVNLSSQQFAHDRLIEKIDSIIAETKINPQNLKIEITESCFILDENTAIKKLQEIQARNIDIWIDDFGTGYSSLSYLHQLPINGLKIDRSFIKEINTNSIQAKIAKAICSLAQDLELDVVAEGIETREQLETIKTKGCKLGQGHFFSQPLNAQKAWLFLKENL
jgi:diguanylate cyclase (GGDEF)-like protein/PAS domain S-box-containing protein